MNRSPPPFFYYVQLQLTGSLLWPIAFLSCNSKTLELCLQVCVLVSKNLCIAESYVGEKSSFTCVNLSESLNNEQEWL